MKIEAKTLIVGFVIVAIIVVATLFTQADLLQGRMTFLGNKIGADSLDPSRIYNLRSKLVSIVTSPVTSPVTSLVTSEGGTSMVTSPVTSPVASGVLLSGPTLEKFDKIRSDFPKLTNRVLESFAKMDYVDDPSRFELSDRDMKEFIKIYQPVQE